MIKNTVINKIVYLHANDLYYTNMYRTYIEQVVWDSSYRIFAYKDSPDEMIRVSVYAPSLFIACISLLDHGYTMHPNSYQNFGANE